MTYRSVLQGLAAGALVAFTGGAEAGNAPPAPSFNKTITIQRVRQTDEAPAVSGIRLGVELTPVSAEDLEAYGAKQGVLVVRVLPDSAAKRAGLLVGDVMTALDGTPIHHLDDLHEAWQSALQSRAMNVTLTIMRGQQAKTLTVTPNYAERTAPEPNGMTSQAGEKGPYQYDALHAQLEGLAKYELALPSYLDLHAASGNAKTTEWEAASRRLARQYRSADPDKRAPLQQELTKILNDIFDAREDLRKREVDRLTRQLSKLQETLKARQKNKSKILERRFKQLTGEEDEWEWSESSQADPDDLLTAPDADAARHYQLEIRVKHNGKIRTASKLLVKKGQPATLTLDPQRINGEGLTLEATVDKQTVSPGEIPVSLVLESIDGQGQKTLLAKPHLITKSHKASTFTFKDAGKNTAGDWEIILEAEPREK